MIPRALLLLLALLPAATASAIPDTEAALVEKAKVEKVVWVAGNQMVTNKVVIDAFRKKYPFLKVAIIDFDYINAKYYFFHLFESDTKGEKTDVVLRAHDKDMDDWIARGWLAKLDDLPGWATRSMPDENSAYFAFYVGMTHGLVYNPKLVKEEDLPQSYDDLLDPKWKGKVLIRSPLKGISAATFSSYIKETRGIDWFRKFGANKPFVTQDYTAQHRLVFDGKYPFALSRDLEVWSFAKQLQRDFHLTSNLKFKLLKEEVPYQYMLAGVNSRAFHPAAARLFVNFLVSPEADALLEKAGFSAGQNRREALARRKSWRWDMSKVSFYEYQSYVARALRLMRDGGAQIEPVLWLGRKRIE